MLEPGTQVKCKDLCPHCGLGDISWQGMDLDEERNCQQYAECIQCGTNFREVGVMHYQFTEVVQ